MKSIPNYFRGVLGELRKVVWPTRQQVINHTIIVLVSAVVAIAVTSLIDTGLTYLVQYLVQARS
ncbi:preprotein translocase subunit SecE [Candidatus Berkelbacteria bacterium CG10_big_fil_rev_8_21_14_0_10_43_13]|uniref:Protein translocase subunit SecE n=1 Tax=Candidatus Berkelbacteria bacterium CG10_big_fil_rev_8_21_14_0_10_43_13 TaxID=1974514 RepID=A0A2H0W6U4_9BACT|nr:MAG: preprotein translocase subunit SecE [Candidatus Berkelbacteria bacterium CG10_big_fil_rev_8_21_14_0_10_43_13]